MRIEPEKRVIKYADDSDVLKVSKATTIEEGGLTVTSGGVTVTAGDLTLTAGSVVQTVPNAVITDPGDAGTITPTSNAVKNICTITTAGAETRVLGTPEFIGQELAIEFGTDGGDFTIANAAGFNDDTTSSDLATFDDAGDCLILIATDTAGATNWRALAKQGITFA